MCSLISYGPGPNTNKSLIVEKREIQEDKKACPHCKSASIINDKEVCGKEILPVVYCYKCGWRTNVQNSDARDKTQVDFH